MLSIQKSLCRLIYTKASNSKKKALSLFHEMECHSQSNSEELRKLQFEKLSILLSYAYQHVPYYKEILLPYFSENDSFSKIPFLTKDTIREQGSKLYSDEHKARGSYKNSSGGSTGIPLVFLQDREYLTYSRAVWMFIKSLRGSDPYDSEVVIWGSERDTFAGRKPIDLAVKDFFLNRITLNSFRMSEQDMQRYLEILNQHKPKLITAYAQSIYELARFAKRKAIPVTQQNAVHTTAMVLHDFMRKEIEEVFQCPVFDHYGSREVGAIATECSAHEGLHVLSENVIVEIVDRHGNSCPPGVEGEIVVTSLTNFSMPLIRYKIGDYGILSSPSSCSCGCVYPKLDKVIGRSTDVFITQDGVAVYPGFFSHILFFREEIKQFQVVQKAPDLVVFRIVKTKDIPNKFLMDISEKTRLLMGKTCRVEFEYPQDIPMPESGKPRFLIREFS